MLATALECTNAQELKELRPTRTCTSTSTSNSAAYVRDRLASYVASWRLLGLDFVNWQQRGWPWSGNSVQVRVLRSTDHMLH